MDTTKEFVKSDQNMTDYPKLKRRGFSKIFKIIIISSLVLFLAIAIVFTILFIKRKDNEGNNKNGNLNPDIKSNNIIVAKYYCDEGKNITLLNPSLIGLKNEDYSIEILEKGGNLRNLKTISNLTINVKETSILTVTIKFKENLKACLECLKNVKI
jgi:flagellar basal body-associated protein FliL